MLERRAAPVSVRLHATTTVTYAVATADALRVTFAALVVLVHESGEVGHQRRERRFRVDRRLQLRAASARIFV
eukprot:3394578-Pleurochrysis_carterae.AAC.1